MSNVTQTTLIIDGAGSETWRVTHASVSERLFTPTRVVVNAWTNAPIDLDAIIGSDATLESHIDDEIRAFHGVVVEADENAVRADSFDIQVVFASKLVVLQRGRDHRIYQEKTVQEVVTDVLDRAGVAAITEWAVNGTYEPHENIVQYGESDYDFVTRLLFEEGIGYVVEQAEDAEHIVFFDDDTAYRAIDGESLLDVTITRTERQQGISDLIPVHRVASDQVMQNDYDLGNPGTDLRTDAEADETTGREVYNHPASYIDPGRGQRLTDRLLERLRLHTRTAEGRGDVLRLATGRFFTVAGSPRADVDGDYVLLALHHTFSGGGGNHSDARMTYENRFEVLPLEVIFRPTSAAPAPAIGGVQHALVTVPGGEEIHADDRGRVKARFLWDRSGIMDDKSSTWLRVGQLALGGSMILPRVDFEVLVDFEMGDVDRPAVSGHLYNAELAPPYALPAGCTVSSMQTATTGGGPGANELRFEDAGGSEEIFINASKDMTSSTENDTNWNVGGNQTYTVGSNNTLSVTADHTMSVAASRTLDIGANQDINVGVNYSDGTGGSLSNTVGGMRLVKSGGDHSENTTGALSRTVGSLQCITGIAGVQRTIVGASTTTVGAAWLELAGASRGLSIKGAYTETVGALKFIKAKNVGINCDAAYTMNGAAELINAGGSRVDEAKGAVLLTAGAAFKVKAKNIIFEAKSKLVFRGGGGVIELTKAGMVTIKAPSVTVKNAKALKQIMHKSN